MNDYIAKSEIHINAAPDKVWDALTNPELIKQYFFGTEAESDWKEGSPLIFRGEWQGTSYLDKGKIVEVVKDVRLRHTYLSSFSGLEDKPENYANITYELFPENNGTKLIVVQDNIKTEDAKNHSEDNWHIVLKGMKELLE